MSTQHTPDQTATIHYGGQSLTAGGVRLSEMPVVTVEQVVRFREEAMTIEQQHAELLVRVDFLNEQNSVLQEQNDSVRQQRDELLAELQKIAGTDFIGVPPRHVIYQITEIAREAIAKARG